MHDHRLPERRGRWTCRVAAVAAVFLAGTGVSADQERAVRPTPGRLVERLVSRADSLRSYALYVPSAYDSTRDWPVLFVLDPRGRALLPMARVWPAAERLGWIVYSSYDTRSDDPTAPNVEAMNAMLDDAQSQLRVDTRRMYLAGFSGTARVAWDFASRLGGEVVAGIIGVGANARPLPGWLASNIPPRVAFFGGAGFTDFNFDEVRAMEPELIAGAYPYRLRYFAGGHEWFPDTLLHEAITWLELQAMRAGRAQVRDTFVDSLLALANGTATRLESTDPPAAHVRYLEIVRDFAGLRDTVAASRRARELARTDAVRDAREEARRITQASAHYRRRLGEFLRDLMQSRRPPSLDHALSRLHIEQLQRQAADTTRLEHARAAQRRLELAFVNAWFYAPRDHIEARQYDHALLMLDVADRIHPNRAGPLVQRARVLAQLGRTDAALDALEAAVRAGLPPAALPGDTLLAPLRDQPRFRALTDGG